MSPREVCDPRFDRLLRASDVRSYLSAALAQTRDTVYGLWPDLKLAYLNPAWFRFAQENGAGGGFEAQWSLGRSLIDALPDVLREHYVQQYAACLESTEPWHHDYECSSPDLYRLFRMSVYPVGGGAGLLVTHALRLEAPHERPPEPFDPAEMADEHGFFLQCAYCRRFASSPRRERWVWIPAWVRDTQRKVTHGICPPCADHYFGARRRRRRRSGAG